MDEIHDELLNIYEEETGVRNFLDVIKWGALNLKTNVVWAE